MYLYLGTSYMYCSSTAVAVAHVLAAPLQSADGVDNYMWHTAYCIHGLQLSFCISILCSCEIEEEKACQESRGRPFVLQRHSSCCLSIQLYIMKATSRFLT